MRAFMLAALALACWACQREAPPPAEKAAPVAPAVADQPVASPAEAPAAEKPADPTPAGFAREWAAVLTAGPEAAGEGGKAMQKRWTGGDYTWTAYALAGLCVEPTRTCALNPWERHTVTDLKPLGGFFPLARFTDADYGRLKIACRGQTGCVVTFRAPLAEVGTDPDEPLRLVFRPATLVTTRAPTEAEQWFDRPPGTPLQTVQAPAAPLRTGEPPKHPLKAPAPKVF